MNQLPGRPSFDDLEAVMRRSSTAPRFTQQRLEPTVLPPPPTHVDLPPEASPIDDIEPDHEGEIRRKRIIKAGLAALALGALLAVAATLFWKSQPVETPLPTQVAPSSQAPVTSEPAPSAAPAEAPPQPPPPVALPAPAVPGPVVNRETAIMESLRETEQPELTAPSVDGLTPPRRVPTRRILMDGDREVSP